MKQLKKSKRPVVLTVKGQAAAIVQDAEAYQRLLDIITRADSWQYAQEKPGKNKAGKGSASSRDGK